MSGKDGDCGSRNIGSSTHQKETKTRKEKPKAFHWDSSSKKVPCKFRVGLPTLINLIKKVPYRRTSRLT